MSHFQTCAPVDTIGNMETALITDRVVAQPQFLETLASNQHIAQRLACISRQLILVEEEPFEFRQRGQRSGNKLDTARPNSVVFETQGGKLLLVLEHVA